MRQFRLTARIPPDGIVGNHRSEERILFKIGHIEFGRWPRLDMRRRAKFLQQHTLAQSLGIALTGFRKIDDPVCDYFIGNVATTSKSKRYQGHFERDAMPYS